MSEALTLRTLGRKSSSRLRFTLSSAGRRLPKQPLLILRLDKMVRMQTLADSLKRIVNAERAGKRQVLLRPVSKTVIRFLRVMQKHGKCRLPVSRVPVQFLLFRLHQRLRDCRRQAWRKDRG